MHKDSSVTTLLDPIFLGALKLPNRLVMAPLTRSRAGESRIPNDLMSEYYKQRAGAGLIISEATVISVEGIGYLNTPGIYSEEQIHGWKGVTETVHKAQGRIYMQLWHMGRISHPSFLPKGIQPVAPSAIPAEGEIRTPLGKSSFPVPRALETAEVKRVIREYGVAAENAMKSGFDGVELHAANGYLPEQFLNDGTNQRLDEYGGSKENRARFILQALEEIIKVWGDHRVGIRLSPSGLRMGTRDSDPVGTYTYLVRELNHFPLAYLHLVEPLQSLQEEQKYLKHVTPYFRDIYKGNLISAGGYNPDSAQYALQQGWADMIAFGKAFIANPDLPERIRIAAALNQADPETFYTFDSIGYTDYPFLKSNQAVSP